VGSFQARYGSLLFHALTLGLTLNVFWDLYSQMPPTSTTIFDEGAQIVSFKLVEKGKYNREGLLHHLVDEPARYNSGTRCLRDVESDLKAQVGRTNFNDSSSP
jgi:hypothetical protein